MKTAMEMNAKEKTKQHFNEKMKKLLIKNGFIPVSSIRTGEHTAFYVAKK